MSGSAVLAVSISIFGEGVDPDEVSLALGTTPDRSHRVGEAVSAESSARRRTGLWSITTHGSVAEEALLAEHIAMLFERVSSDVVIWRQLADRHSTRVSIGWFMGEGNEALRVDASIVDELARRALHLDIDVFAPPADD
jgi:Domain of unknown function (DUF4279)